MIQDEIRSRDADDQKFAMRPDTIMWQGDNIFIVDAKFYTGDNLPSSSSISKQIVYGQFVEQKLCNENLRGGATYQDCASIGNKIFNVFLLPYRYECNEGNLNENCEANRNESREPEILEASSTCVEAFRQPC
ncbi:LlaJI restriction endonuclease [Fibrobacter sp. UWR4]|uniref:LlaJI family restriction endonuclease n=1 Tax=Fibrobacter sp. UWR4 TaxID=1896218 RepID=UPI000D6D5FED|nr:LlaJI family restriction endonuclease [Fibrobacter sp. UWR4]PWJ58581.1 LlaJI restriction endonuclease [Fibrobacter sp. UWR4]